MVKTVKNNNTSFLFSTDPLDRLMRMGKKVDYTVNYKKELCEALDEKYRNIHRRKHYN